MSKLSLLIFDLDDTLIHSNIDYTEMKKRVRALFDQNYSFSNNPTIKELLGDLEKDPDKFQQAYAIINKIESDSSTKAELIPFADQIPSLVKELQVFSAVLTNNSKQSVTKYLTQEKFDFLHDMGPIITRDDVSGMKPDPAGLNKIIQMFNFHNKREEVIFIGDSFIDADASFNAGIRFILVNYRKLNLEYFTNKPWKILNQLSELANVLRQEMIDCTY